MNRFNFYSAAGFDRAAHRRGDDGWLARRLANPATRLVPVWRDRNLVVTAGYPRPATLSVTAMSILEAGETIWLGRRSGDDYFAVDLNHLVDPALHQLLPGAARFVDLREIGSLLPRDDGALLAYARGLVHWHRRHGFCGLCGSPTDSRDAGHRRQCRDATCGAHHFPRTDPAVIVLVHDGRDRVLLARSPKFPPGIQSVLAGFVEPGESLEDTVAREVGEEAGVSVTDIAYHSSQPWPFPASLMIGFTARATSFTLSPDPAELETAAWYSRSDIDLAVRQGRLRMPRPDSIARRMLDEWLSESDGAAAGSG